MAEAARVEREAVGPDRRVLIIDDEPDFGLSLADIIESRGYEVALVQDGAAAEARLATFAAAVALVDIRLGLASGLTLIGRLKERDPDLLCVMMTAYADVDSAVRALQAGAYDYLRKPFDAAELLATLGRCFERRALVREKRLAEEALRARNTELAEVNARLRLMVEAASRLPQHQRLGELTQALLEDFARLMAAEGGSLYRREADGLRLAASLGEAHCPETIPLPLRPHSILGRACESHAPVLMRDIRQEPDVQPSGWGGYQDGSVIAFPIVREGEVLALLSLHNKTWPPFTEQDRDLGRVMISVAAGILTAQQAHEAVQASEQRFRALFESSADGILLLSDERLVDCNERAAELFGLSRAALLAGRPWDLLAPLEADNRVSRSLVLEKLAAARRGDRRPFEWRCRRGDGTLIEVELSLSPAQVGGADFVQAIVRDITERKRTETQLVRLATAVENADEDILVTDSDGRVLYVNPAFERITGYARQEILGQNPRVLKSGTHGPTFYRELWRTLLEGRTWLGRFTNRRKDGALILQDASISPIRDAAGLVLGYVSVKRDVTRQVSLERHLAQAQKMDALGTLAGGIAHDFNNILSAILGYVDLSLRSAEPGSKLERHLGNIRAAARRAADLTRQILAFSRRGPQEFRPTDIRAVVDEALQLLRASLPTTIEIRSDLRSESAILADATQIHQVLMNLGVNAGLAMGGGGILEVRLEDLIVEAAFAEGQLGLVPGRFVRLTVSDTGVGMSPEVVARIFEPFFTTRPRGEGTGMGLAVVHGIVRHHGGAIIIGSTPGKGTRFDIYLPVQGSAPLTPAISAEPLPRGDERILLVDDEEFHRGVTREMLEDLGYRVTCCNDGREALERLRSDPRSIDLVLTDITMPGLTGDMLTRETLRLRPELPVLLCTGFGEQWTAEEAGAEGARGLLLKPVSLAELAHAVRGALGVKAP